MKLHQKTAGMETWTSLNLNSLTFVGNHARVNKLQSYMLAGFFMQNHWNFKPNWNFWKMKQIGGKVG